MTVATRFRQAWIILLVLLICDFSITGAFRGCNLPNNNNYHPKDSKTIGRSLQSLRIWATGRQTRVQSLFDWADSVNIQIAKNYMSVKYDDISSLGLYSNTATIPPGSVVLSVPTKIALSVEVPGEGPNLRAVIEKYGKDIRDLPWFAQMSLYLNYLKQDNNNEFRAWISSLPTSFDTPFHWNTDALKELQYKYLVDSVKRQQDYWKELYDSISSTSSSSLSGKDFVWGCECARSRAFSGAYTGSGFNPGIYAFVLLLITIYVGLNLGTLEQAANGAGIVFSASVLKDFVLPKFFKKKRYIICPMIDVVNHRSVGYQGDVSFEYFANSYSLALSKASPPIASGEQLFISYGTRSNDQLLQYYGFVESDNPHDIYVMPSVREWDIAALERSCGRTIAPGRLAKLDQAGLLDASILKVTQTGDDSDSVSNVNAGVILTSEQGIDPAVMQTLRALIATDDEWKAAGESIGTFATEYSGGSDNEKCARIIAKTAMEMELASKPTTLQNDLDKLQRIGTIQKLGSASPEDILALKFRIEKKKLLQKSIDRLI